MPVKPDDLRVALRHLDCKVDSAHDTGTHTIFVRLVEADGVSEKAHRPLLYYSQGYRQLVDDS
jgi:flavin reductase (DIM6/NTAB) family NADH-FMN oxidoreductase RutF